MSADPKGAVERLADMAEFFEEATNPFIAESVCVEHGVDLRWALATIATLTRERDEALRHKKALGLDLQKAWAALNNAEVLADVAERLGEYASDIRRAAAILSDGAASGEGSPVAADPSGEAQ